jgi:hypothetical protein
LNQHWRHWFCTAIFVGEVLGYSLERLLRVSHLHHLQSIERLRREKERIHYELLMSQKQQQQPSLANDRSNDNASSSACSELAVLHSQTQEF